MKRILTIALAIIMSLALFAGCAPTAEETPAEVPAATEAPAEVEEAPAETEEAPAEMPATVTISVTDAKANPIDVEFPTNPEKVVVLNYATLDFLDAMGMGDKVVGLIKSGEFPEHLVKYKEDENIVDLGSMKDIDVEGVMSLQPDIIFTSDRTEGDYDQYSQIAPTFAVYADYTAEDGFVASHQELQEKHAEIFGVQDQVAAYYEDYNARIAAINEFATEKTALMAIFAGGGLNFLGDSGRCSIITNEMGFDNIGTEEDINHGEEGTMEVFLEKNPEYIFVLDKDTAVGDEAVLAEEQMDNEIVQQTDAYANDKIHFLKPDSTWYVGDAGIQSLGYIIEDIEKACGLK